MNSVIYKITSPAGKVYIGQTINFESRMTKHKSVSECPNAKGYSTILCNAIRKYGWANMKREIICVCSGDVVSQNEQYLIKVYNSLVPNGYNMTVGGEVLAGQLNPYFGKQHSEATKKLMKLNHKRPFKGRFGKLHNRSKAVLQFDLDNNFLGEFGSCMDAERETGVNHSNISAVCLGKYSQTHNYVWRYKQ